MPDLVFDRSPPAEAADHLARKAIGGRFSFDWRDVSKEEHTNSFVVAKAMTADLLTDLHGGLMSAFNEGWTKERYIAELRPTLQAKGWWGKKRQVDPVTGEERLVTLGTPRRLGVIYDTNIRMAHAAGRWERFLRSASTRPFLTYHHTPQEHPRPMHLAWDKITLPIEHVFWTTHYCPNGWGCKCYATSVRRAEAVTSEEELKARGVYDRVPWVNKRTGETTMVPKGIDRGFDYNVGQSRMKALAAPAMAEPAPPHVPPRQPQATPPDPPAARRLPRGVGLRDDLPDEPKAVFEAFSKAVGTAEGEVFTDAAQVPLVMSQRMIERYGADGTPSLAIPARLAEVFAAALRDPDEIWHSIQARADGTSVLSRTIIAAFDVPTLGRTLLTLIFHEGANRGVWMGASALATDKAGKPLGQAKAISLAQRIGLLVFKRK